MSQRVSLPKLALFLLPLLLCAATATTGDDALDGGRELRQVSARVSRRTVFHKDARRLLQKLRASKELKGAVPFARAALKAAAAIPDQSTIFLPLAVGQVSFVLRSLPKNVSSIFINYHIVTSYNKYSDLRGLASGTDLPTVEGSAISKIGRGNGTLVFLQDKTLIPKILVLPNLVALTSFVVHGVCCVLVPKDY